MLLGKDKKIPKKKHAHYAAEIKKQAISYAIGVVTVEEIDKIDLPEGQLIRIRNRGEFIALGRGGVTDGVAVIKPEKLFVIDPPKDN